MVENSIFKCSALNADWKGVAYSEYIYETFGIPKHVPLKLQALMIRAETFYNLLIADFYIRCLYCPSFILLCFFVVYYLFLPYVGLVVLLHFSFGFECWKKYKCATKREEIIFFQFLLLSICHLYKLLLHSLCKYQLYCVFPKDVLERNNFQ